VIATTVVYFGRVYEEAQSSARRDSDATQPN